MEAWLDAINKVTNLLKQDYNEQDFSSVMMQYELNWELSDPRVEWSLEPERSRSFRFCAGVD